MLGALLATLAGRRLRQAVAPLLAWVAGIMFAVAAFDLLPAAWRLGARAGVAGLALGVAVVLGVERLQPSPSAVVAWGIAAHNFPEGLAIGAGFAHERAVGLAITLLLALHDLPEGMAIALPQEAGPPPARPRRPGAGRWAAAFWLPAWRALVAGLPTLLGALAGHLAGVDREALAVAMGFAAGAMLEVTAGTLLPAAWSADAPRPGLLLAALTGCATGWLLTRLLAA
ncbi:MAG: hypothetical protein QJR14_05785 [Bacillota bacterium]|nr:hypothetical protein [Bacillota bacterium]